MIRVILLIALLSLVSCKEQPTKVKSTVLKDPTLTIDERGFDSCMNSLEKSYPFFHHLLPDKNENYLNIYSLERRIYVPALRNLTFDLYQFRRFSEYSFPVIYMHNDSFQFVLPFIDFEYYRIKTMEKNDTLDINRSLSLSKEYGKLIQKLKPIELDEKVQLLDVLMSFLKAERVMGETGAEIFEAKTNDFMVSPGMFQGCPDEVRSNVNLIKAEITKRYIVYTNGIVTFILKQAVDGTDSLGIYNGCCAGSLESVYH